MIKLKTQIISLVFLFFSAYFSTNSAAQCEAGLNDDEYRALTAQAQIDYFVEHCRQSDFEEKFMMFSFGQLPGRWTDYVPGYIKLLDDPDFKLVAYSLLKNLITGIPEEIRRVIDGETIFDPNDEIILACKYFMETGYDTAKKAVDGFESKYHQSSPSVIAQDIKYALRDVNSERLISSLDIIYIVFKNHREQYKDVMTELKKDPAFAYAAEVMLSTIATDIEDEISAKMEEETAL